MYKIFPLLLSRLIFLENFVEGLVATDIQPGESNGYQNMSVGLTNTGNAMLKPYGALRIMDTQNHVLRNLPLKLDTLLPQTSINYAVGLQGQVLSAGNYTAGHTLYYAQAFTITQQQLTHIFKAGGPQQYTLPSTTTLLVAGIILLLAAGGALFGGYILCRTVVLSATKRMMSKK